MFYNCENLLFSSGHIYEKLTNLSRVVVAAGEGTPPAIIGLAEVENDSIMRRWTQRTPLAKWHYRFVVTDSPDVRGINVALMYQPDDYRVLGHESVRIVMPDDIRPTRDLLHVWGRVVNGDTVDVVVCHLPSRYGGKKASDKARAIAHAYLRHLMDSISACRVNPHLIVMGDFNDYPTSKQVQRNFSGYVNLMLPLQKALMKGRLSYGSHKYAGEWGFLDHFLVNVSMRNVESAPCFVKLPVSSLLNVQNMLKELLFFVLIKLYNAGNRFARSSNLGAEINSSFNPIFLDLSLLYRYKS